MLEEDAKKLKELLGESPEEEQDEQTKAESPGGKVKTEMSVPKEELAENLDVESALGVQENEKESPTSEDHRKKLAISRINQILKKNRPEGGEDEIVKRNAPRIADLETSEEQIEKLVELAKFSGVDVAIKTARGLSNFVVDQTYGELTADKLHEELVKLGMIKETP